MYKTYPHEQLLCMSGCRVNAYCENRDIKDAVVYVEGTTVYLLQDYLNGMPVKDETAYKKYGKKYSWCISTAVDRGNPSLEIIEGVTIGFL